MTEADSYDAARDGFESYHAAIDAMRDKLESFPRVELGPARLYLGDCREIMPLLPKFDAVCTDPPYGLGDWNERGSNKGKPFADISHETQEWDQPLTTADVDALRKAGKHQILWGANYYLDSLPRTKMFLIWNKGVRRMHYNDAEIAWTSEFRQATRVFDLSPNGLEKEHPTQKPLALMRWCLSYLPNAKTILDPYMGTGTTGVAAVQLGREFVGIERERKYFDIACRRIDQALREPRLDLEPAPKAIQEGFDL